MVLACTDSPEEKCGPFCWASVEYRLVPEHQFPSNVDDLVSACRSLSEKALAEEFNYSPSKMCMLGVSAGGFVAGHALLHHPCPCALLYPMVDPSMGGASHRLYGDLPGCPSEWLRLAWDWLGAERASLLEADFSPLQNSQLLLLLGSCDPLRDEGRELSKRLLRTGVAVTTIEAQGSHAMAHLVDRKSREDLFESFKQLLPM